MFFLKRGDIKLKCRGPMKIYFVKEASNDLYKDIN